MTRPIHCERCGIDILYAMPQGFALSLGLAMQVFSQSKPPYREILKPGSDAAYRKIENKIASGCMELGLPHPYIGIEPLTGRKEIWFLNGFGETS